MATWYDSLMNILITAAVAATRVVKYSNSMM